MINEEEIRKEVYGRQHKIHISTNWATPGGRRRSVPVYETIISNEYLKDQRVIRGHSAAEVTDKVKKQLERWNYLEIRGRLGGVVRGIREEVESVHQILENALNSDCKIDWL